jgi:hypothetical protein
MVDPAPTATPPTHVTPPNRTPITATTERGFATASLALAVWGMLVFWWYPFGLFLASVGVVLGLIAVALGIRAGRNGEHLALLGLVFGSIAVGLALGVYRFVQYAFEGSVTGGLFN